MKMNPYLSFDGKCEEAMKFYERCLDGKITMMIPFAGSPMAEQVPAERVDKIMHARLIFGENVLMASDAPEGCYEMPKGTVVSLNLTDVAEAERLYSALSEGGTIHMPIQETFWAVRFASFRDQFGTPWMINCEKSM